MDSAGGHDLGEWQREHWTRTYGAHPDMYGLGASESARRALALFAAEQVQDVLELGAGQGRDTLPFLHAGLRVTALELTDIGITAIGRRAAADHLDDRLDALVRDVREPLPAPAASMDAVYSHMLLCMAFRTRELHAIAGEIRRVLRPGGLHVYTVRHTGDPHYRAGTSHGDNIWEHGGFAVHFFDDHLVDQLATGMDILDRTELAEGDLPRRLWQVTLRKVR